MSWVNARVAVVFDNTVRPETTGVYCRRALAELVRSGQLADFDHVLPSELSQVVCGQFDLILFVDDGLDYAIPELGCPSIFWAIDTHINFARCLLKSTQATWTFAAQQQGARGLAAAGIKHVEWLPLACDPVRHARETVPITFDVSFVGNPFPGPRSELIEFIRTSYPQSFVGRKYFEEMARVYSASKIVFNRSLDNDLNMRVFEGLCSGALFVTDELIDNGLSDLFQNGVHLVTYRCQEDLKNILDHYLDHEDERARIAEAGRQEVLARHTYRHRLEAMLEQICCWSAVPPLGRSDTTRSPGNDRCQLIPDQSSASESQTLIKHSSYFEWARPEILELIPASARRILDIGCGAGRLGESIKARQPASITGIEIDPSAAELAATRLDEVKIINVEDPLVTFDEGQFDCVICADILEHLRHPERVLSRIKNWLTPDGCIVVSVPNARNHTVLRSLLAGNWTYESAGLLDEDHVRFFTRRELEKLLFRSGFSIPELRMVGGEGYDAWIQQGRSRQVSIGGLEIKATSPDDAAEFFAYQYLARSRPEPKRAQGLTSIILVTHNQWSFTQQCLDSVRLRTDERYELIVIDNGSTDGTVEALKSCGKITVIANETNRGFPAAVNQGLAVANGENMLLLNNDTIVTTGWLRRMLDALHSDSKIGLLGPVSNCVSGEQQIESTYSHLSELDGFAWDWGRDHGHELVETDRLVGFCLLLKRAVYESIGALDEQFGVGNFEDDDYCRRAHQVGFKTVICRGAFVHHFGGATFRATGVDFQSLLETNHRKFVEKHNTPEPVSVDPDSNYNATPSLTEEDAGYDRDRPHFLAEIGSEPGLRLIPNRIRLSVCLIVRDNENTIRPCLESIRPWVDEIVVVDTGSKDHTPQICEELGARLYRWAWQDDFSAARNVSFRHARGEWIFWMDSDDTISSACGKQLQQLVNAEHSDSMLGYVIQVHCPGVDQHDVTVVDHVKLIRNRPYLRFEFRIHEQILPSIRRAGGDVAFTDIYVTHSGADHSIEGKRRKLERDLRILDLDLAARPDHPFVLFNLGMTFADAGDHQQAIRYLKRSITVAHPNESHLRKAYALLVSAHRQNGEQQYALRTCEAGLEIFSEDLELNFLRGTLLQEAGQLRQAVAAYHRVLVPAQHRYFVSLESGISGHKVHHNLAIVLEDLGDLDSAENHWRKTVAEQPSYHMGWRGLCDLLLKGGRLAEVSIMLREMPLHLLAMRSEALLIEARLSAARGDLASALIACQQAEAIDPEQIDALQLRCRLLFERGAPSDAIDALRELTLRRADDPSAWHNLGSMLFAQHAFGEAVKCYDRSLRFRPDYEDSLQMRSQAIAQLSEVESFQQRNGIVDFKAANLPAMLVADGK